MTPWLVVLYNNILGEHKAGGGAEGALVGEWTP